MKQKKTFLILIFILFVGAILRFYKLDWGQGLFTHPDEYHIATSVNQLSFPNQMHPHFFSYGTVIIYLIYFTQELLKYLSTIFNFQFSIFNSFLIGRFYSALFSALSIFIVYKISKTFMKTRFSLLAALLTSITPGLIQQAHFATPESALIFFLLGSLLFIIESLKFKKILYSILASIFLGLALGVKISSVVFLLPLIIAIIIPSLKKPLALIERIFLSLITVFTTFILAAPFVFIDYPAFRSNLDYEGSLAVGKLPVFYTRQFIDTTPVLFQLEKTLPYALGLPLLIAGLAGLLFSIIMLTYLLIIRIYPNKNTANESEYSHAFGLFPFAYIRMLLIIAFLSLFLPNAFLFAKWTRFIAPTFPFFAIFAAFFLQWLSKKTKLLYNSLLIILLVSTILWTIAFFSIYANTDVRITSSEWLESNVKPGSVFLVEGGNMVDLPLRGNFPRISLDFYNLENDPMVRARITDALYTSDYFLVQSRRVFMNHQRLPSLFPKTSKFYDALFDGRLGFEQIKEFHSYPKLEVKSPALSGVEGLKLQVPDEGAEETWSVFDHPVIRVFKKNSSFTKEDYAKFFEI